MNIYPSDSYMSDDDLLQGMEEYLYNPLPDGLVERDWLGLPEMERDWLDLPDMERDWFDLPTVEQEWLDTPDFHEQNHEEHMLSDTLDLDREF